jgi:predicted MFS family arabinose efflux permease
MHHRVTVEMAVVSDLAATEAEEIPPSRGSLQVFHHRDFALFFTAASISNGGSWMQLVAVQALLFDLTDSGSWLGFSTVVSLVPAMILTPYAGVLADRVSRQAILRVTQTMQMLMAFSLWALYVSDLVTPWWIIAIGLVNGIATGFQTAAWQSFVPLLVPDEDMLQAVRLNSVQFTLARAIGPALGGVVVKFGGIGAAILCNAVTYLLVIAVLIVVRPRANRTTARSQRVLEGLEQGARYIWDRRPLRLAVLLALAASTFGQSLQFIASALSERLYGHSSEGNAGLLTALGFGAVLSSAITIRFGDRLPRSVQALGALGLYTVSLTLLPTTSSYAVAQFAYFLAGIAHLQIAVALNTLIQGAVPDAYRGRAMSFYLLGILAGIPLGSQLLGSLGDLIGFRSTLVLDGVAFLAVIGTLVVTGWWRDLDATPEQIDPVGFSVASG